ncbi:uncharacterized protein CcaverHIS019_0604670 [Cutaneotrichosporon cavernicola]|uniref:P-loop containing nucleoside triphosphate hydrolase protein n=1 Tax=Cutaneotrichosporon cavernicola TaxID=279322 RepID=A0AA48QY57_9TREE|nr:uncharacterized protein CcaverHIS019_0604670 [Cutaneotrichosporon cavernicola]BEI94008.1 hypothetical protein CcaverHIS019_0604670 [Cutaneotrichosporon cavernicola]BEJ01788.1 hypothetical protein CcaverHIS631_0604700 [Cutaneotrichosporon cavernicola]
MSCGVWDGSDFTPCFRDQYIANASLVLAALGAAFLLFPRRRGPEITTASLVPPGGGLLSQLEARVLLRNLASSLSQPDSLDSTKPEEKIASFRRATTGWDRFYYWVSILGALVWIGLEVYRLPSAPEWEDFRPLIFPIVILLMSAAGARALSLLTLHLVPSLLLFRSGKMGNYPSSPLSTIIVVWEVVYWAILVCTPYHDPLDRLVGGAVSRGGVGGPRHIEEPCTALSRATYWFILPFLWKHYWKPITLEEIPAVREDDSAAACVGAFRRFQAAHDAAYEVKHNSPRKRNLAWDLITFFRPELVRQSVVACSFVVLQYLPPTGMRLLLQQIGQPESDRHTGTAALYVAMMAIGQSLSVVVYGNSLMLGRRVCIRMRAIIVGEVFAKALRREDRSGTVKKGADGEDESSSDGKVNNLVSVDAFAISEVCAYVFMLVSSPFALAVNLTLLYMTLGPAAVAGVAVLVALIPVQTVLGRLFTVFQRRLMSATDKRLDAATEVISFMKLIKYNSWQGKFLERMSGTRTAELGELAKRFAIMSLSDILVWATPVFVTGTAFGVHVLLFKQPLTPDRAFASLVLFNMLRDPLGLFQDVAIRLIQAYTSACRIQDFLNEPETLKYTQVSTPGPSDPAIGFHDALFSYPGEEGPGIDGAQPFRLGELNLSFPKGELSLVTGPVGSGKTTLILSLLGETVLLTGEVFMPNDRASRDLCPVDPVTGLSNTVAYCAQTAWLIGASIRENIVFGSEWDETRYKAVVHACALERDFEIFDLGDETEVGEKGTTCSGGQKARIALARALYSSAATVILDDVLSAVDAQTARHIYTHVLKGPLMKGRTCILVTHAVGLCLPAASFVVMLDDGKAVSGTPAMLVASGALEAESEPSSPTEGETPDAVNAEESISTSSTKTSRSRRRSVFQGGDVDDSIEDNLDGMDYDALVAKKRLDAIAAGDGLTRSTSRLSAMTAEDQLPDKRLVQDEESNQGSVRWGTYLLYFRAEGGVPFWIVLSTTFIGAQVLQFLSNWWIKEWSGADQDATRLEIHNSVLTKAEHSVQYYLLIYLAISGVYVALIAARIGMSFMGSLHASEWLYSRMLARILGAKLRFFDATPSGRILNRLSKDMSSIDQETTLILMLFVNSVLSCVTVLIVVAYSSPAFLIAFPVITVLYWIVGTLYVTTSREIKRYDSVTRSPIFVSFSEALVGMSTIRSYGDSARFMSKLLSELDTNTRCFWYLWQANRALNVLSNFIGTLITVAACVLALQSGMNAAAAGLSITYALSFTDYVLWVVRLYADAEMTMNSVERISEYLELEQEEPKESKGVEPPAPWPSRDGSIVVSNLTCKYAPQLDPVLRDLSFVIGPGEKIGICGRTGSGKSTLALSFFRFLYQERGSIVIDGLDIGKLSLATLRSRLTILPQEAQLFSGTVRDNMDPFGQHEDVEIWDALRQCGLTGRTPGASLAASRAMSRSASRAASRRGSVQDLVRVASGLDGPGSASASSLSFALGFDEERVMIRSLDEPVAAGGRNFSQGQRQLLALARGLLKLRNSSFLIMDESTANLDHATDATIQNVIRTGLEHTQMLVIAHRLMTVCGLDKILVLDHGRKIEFGTPWDLLQDPNGSFRQLCRQSGEEAQLMELAKSVHERKQEAQQKQ